MYSSIFAITATLAIIVGVGVAWTSSGSGSFTSSAGSLSVALDFSGGYGYLPNQVYPTNSPINVLWGRIKNNTPADPGIPVQATTGTTTVTGASNVLCNYGTISGDVVVTNSAFVASGGAIGGEWVARLTMGTGAVDACQGNALYYNVVVNVGT
jgi:hypothetical protein